MCHTNVLDQTECTYFIQKSDFISAVQLCTKREIVKENFHCFRCQSILGDFTVGLNLLF